MALNYLAPAPYASFITRNGAFQADGNGLISNVGVGAQALDLFKSGCVPLAINHFANFRNLIDGGDFSINPWQRNIAALATSGVLTTPNTGALSAAANAYFADRFFTAGSGSSPSVGQLQLADTAVAGFSQSLQVFRSASGANTSPIYVGQVIETLDSIKCQAQPVTFSFWARAAAAYTGGSLSVSVVAGSGTNQSATNLLGGSWSNQTSMSLTPSSALGAAGAPATQPVSAVMTRYSFTGTIPAAISGSPVRQIGVLISWTPTGTAPANNNDGVIINGVQFEIGALSPFEHRDVSIETELCQRFCWVIAEPASGVVVGAGSNSATNTQIFYLATPVQMIKAPSVTTSAGSFKANSSTAGVVAATGLTGNTTHSPNAIGLTSTGTGTAGQATLLQGGGGSGWIIASADF